MAFSTFGTVAAVAAPISPERTGFVSPERTGFVSLAAAADPEPVDPVRPAPGVAPTTVTTNPTPFSGTGFATVSGTKQSGSSVSVTVNGASACTVKSDSRTEWSCGRIPLASGAALAIVATETPAAGAAQPQPGTTTLDVLGPPTLDGAGSYVTTGLVSGIGRPGAVVALSIDGAVDAKCGGVPIGPSGYWSCAVAAPSGRYFIRAQQSDRAIGSGRSSDYSNVQDVVVDRDAPTSASITAPASGSRFIPGSLVVSGTGEDRASIDVYLDNVPACSTQVAGTTWSCTIGTLPRGSHTLQAVQRDVAGNYASPSGVVAVTVGAAAVTAPKPSATPSPKPRTTPTPTPETPPSPTPDQVAPAAPPAPSPGTTPIFPRPDGSAPTLSEALTNWSVPTGFGSGLSSLSTTLSRNWSTAPLIALLFVALVALPVRMLASALRGRVAPPRARLTGRNRPRAIRSADAAPQPRRLLTGALPLAAAAVLIALSVGVGGEVRYLRLLLAIALGLAVLNLVGGLIAVRFGARWTDLPIRFRFVPLMLLAAAVTAVLSRWTGLEPPVITGVLIGAGFALGVSARRRALVNLVQVGAVTVLGVLGWIAFELAGPASGSSFVSTVLAETLATICLAGLGSALVLMLPIASLPGRAILEWSRSAWIGATLAISTIVALVVAGDGPVPLAILPWAVGAVVFAALSVAVWAFVRYVEPQTRV